MRRFYLLIFLLMAVGQFLKATTFQVGATRTYTSPNALYLADVLDDGDTIEIDAAEYTGTAALANWTANNLVIRGVGGRPHLIADGENILGKGIWVCTGNNIIVENIEFSGAAVLPDENGSGIRLDGIGLTVRHCYFHENENGILATSADVDGVILVEHTEFSTNGSGSGQSHNIYVNDANKLIFRYNYSHHANVGHNLKSRADTNYVYCNRIMDEATGNSSRLIDIPNGGPTMIIGNSFMQGNMAPNNNLVGYGLEGLDNPAPHDLYVVNNTFVNKRVQSCRFLQVQDGTNYAHVANNIFAGDGLLFVGDPIDSNLVANYVETTVANLQFVDESNYDYHLGPTSPAINKGVAQTSAHGFDLTPVTSYQHPMSSELRTIVSQVIDAGAYEQGVILPISLISFRGEQGQDLVQLKWTTAFELNNAGFEVQRSSDGMRFQNIGWIPAGHNGQVENNYSFKDFSPGEGTYYYRLHQIDLDGTSWHSEVISFSFGNNNSPYIFPNPVKGLMYLPEKVKQFDIFSITGKQMLQGASIGGRVEVGFLESGMYYLRSNEGKIYSFIKE